MSKRSVAIIFALLLLGTPLSVVSIAPVSGDSTSSGPIHVEVNNTSVNVTTQTLPPVATLSRTQSSATPHTTARNPEARIPVVIELTGGGADHLSRLQQYGVTVQARAGSLVKATLPRANRSAVRALTIVETIRTPNRPHTGSVSGGVAAIGADAVHDQGITGENITVGVIDLGFNVTHPALASNIVEYKSFTGDISPPGRTQHGTAVSDVVLDTAPNASLYVTNVYSAVGFVNAVAWLQAHDIDIITTSLAWYGVPGDGTSLVSKAATAASRNGTVVFSSAGNAATRHWMGNYTPGTGDRWVNFSNRYEANSLEGYLSGGEPVGLTLTWNDWERPSEDYDLYLYQQGAAVTNWVARSTNNQSAGYPPVEQIATRVPEDGQYFVAIRAENASRTAQLELYAYKGRTLEYATPRSSLTPPADAYNVTAVGAFRYSTGELEPFSSHGPTNDGRRGLDIVGPDGAEAVGYPSGFFGTSAAAPYVAGVAALALDRNPNLASRTIHRIITRTARDMANSGPDPSTGFGRVHAPSAVNMSTPVIHVDEFNVSPTTATAGQPLQISVVATNTGLVAGNITVTLAADGVPIQNHSLSVPVNASTQRAFTHSFATLGTHTISVGKLPAKSVYVPSNLQFNNQTLVNRSANVTLRYVNATEEYYVEIVNSSSHAVYGRTDTFAAGTAHSNLSISLTNALSIKQSLTAIVWSNQSQTKLGTQTAIMRLSPVARYDRDGDGIGIVDLFRAINDYRSGDLVVTDLLRVIDRYQARS